MRVQIIKEVTASKETEKYRLWFQWCLYVYDDGTSENGYRFIWRKDGNLMPTRGQARINSIAHIEALIKKAKEEGWGDYDSKQKEGVTNGD